MFKKVDTTAGKTVCVVSGGNVDVTTLSRVITKGLSKAGRLVEITTKVMDKPGGLLQLLQVVADTGANIVTINHAREAQLSDVGACIVTMVLETRNSAMWPRFGRSSVPGLPAAVRQTKTARRLFKAPGGFWYFRCRCPVTEH